MPQAEAYLEPSQTSMMDISLESSFYLLIIFGKKLNHRSLTEL